MPKEKSKIVGLAGVLLAVAHDFFDQHEVRGVKYRFRMPDGLAADMAFDMAEPDEQTKAMAQARAIIEFLKD